MLWNEVALLSSKVLNKYLASMGHSKMYKGFPGAVTRFSRWAKSNKTEQYSRCLECYTNAEHKCRDCVLNNKCASNHICCKEFLEMELSKYGGKEKSYHSIKF